MNNCLKKQLFFYPPSQETMILVENECEVSYGGVGGAGAGAGQQAPAVLGLAAASGDNSLFQIIPAFIFIFIGFAWFAFLYKTPTIIQTKISDFAKEPIVADQAFKKTSKESDIKNIIIPRLNIDLLVTPSKIIDGYWQVSETNASHGEGSANPGEGGNVVVFAHAREGLFLGLRDIKKDNVVYILTSDGWYKYKVSEIISVYPNDITTVAPTDSEMLTLFTCSGFFDDKRLIVKAIPEE